MMKLNNKLLHWILLGGLGLSAVIFLAVMFQGISLLSSKSKQLVDMRVQSQTADAQLSNLEQTKKDVEKYSYFKNVATTVIPNDKNQAEAILEINQKASQAGIALQSITFPTSTLGGTTTGSTADAATSSSSKAISQAKPVSGIAGLYSLQLTITTDNSKTLPADQQATYPKILNFLNQIENNRRTAQITDVSIQPSSDNPSSLSLTLIINIFMKP